MRIVELKEDDERFGHKAGDLFVVEEADYDSEKLVGVKIVLQRMDNSFYKEQVRSAGHRQIGSCADEVMRQLCFPGNWDAAPNQPKVPPA